MSPEPIRTGLPAPRPRRRVSDIDLRISTVLALCAWLVSTGVGIVLLVDGAGLVVRQRNAHRAARALVARVLADDAAHRAVAAGEGAVVESATWCAVARLDPVDGRRITVEVAERGAGGGGPPVRFAFSAPLLQGAAPPVLGRPSVFLDRDEGPVPLADDPAVRLAPSIPSVPPALAGPRDPNDAAGRMHDLHEDRGIALRFLDCGTDAPDYVLAPPPGKRLAALPRRLVGDALRLEGNLWIGNAPGDVVDLHLERSATLVVRGNVYLLGDLVVSGPGHLTLVTESVAEVRGPSAGRSRSGSPRPTRLEGSGNLWVGIPGRPAPAGRGDHRIGAGLVVGRDLRFADPDSRLLLDAGLVLRGSVHPAGARSRLSWTRERLPDPAREFLPGFRVEGPPRPGTVTPLF